jgi:hypothetical protein
MTPTIEPGLPELPSDDDIEQHVYEVTGIILASASYEPIRKMLRTYALSAIAADRKQVSAGLSDLKRYDPEHGSSPQWDNVPPIVMAEDPNGEYVRFDDVCALSSRLLPPDWVAVPKFPTQPMRDAGNKALDMLKTEPGMGIADRAYYAYTAMIAVAPSIEGNSQQAKPMPPDGYRCADCGSYAPEPMPKEG